MCVFIFQWRVHGFELNPQSYEVRIEKGRSRRRAVRLENPQCQAYTAAATATIQTTTAEASGVRNLFPSLELYRLRAMFK